MVLGSVPALCPGCALLFCPATHYRQCPHLCPAGTGKTLSLICASLQWLHDQRQREAAEAAAAAARAAAGGGAQPPAAAAPGQAGAAGAGAAGASAGSDDDAPDWMRDFGEEQERQRQQQLLERQQKRIARAKAKLLGTGGSRLGGGQRGGGRRPGTAGAAGAAGAATDDPDAEFLMDEWQSDGEEACAAGGPGSARKRGPGAAGLQAGLDSSSGSDSEGGGSGGEGLGEGEEVEAPRKQQVGGRRHSSG